MPNWKKVIVSGSDAALNSLNVTTSLTASGLIYPDTDGVDGQVLKTDGLGNLFFENTITTTISIKNVSGGTIPKGTPCYITGSGTAGNVAGVWPADASNPLRMPAGVIAGETLNNGDEGVGLLNGFINGVDTSIFNAGDSVYVKAGGGYTNVRPTGSTIYVQKLGNIEKSDASNGSGVINGPGYYNDLPNVQQGYTWVGNSNGVAIATATSSIQNVVSSSFASTASYVNTLNQNVTITGSLAVTSSVSINNSTYSNQTNTLNSETKTIVSIFSAGAIHMDYYVTDGSSARAGTFVGTWDGGGSREYYETATNDIGNTTDVTFTVTIPGSQLDIECTAASSGWTVLTNTRTLTV